MDATALYQGNTEARRPTDATSYAAPSALTSGTPSAGAYEGIDFPGVQSLVLHGSGRPAGGVIGASLGRTIGTLWTDIVESLGTQPFTQPLASPDHAAITAVDAAYAVMDLLGVTMETLASITGIGRTTILNWRRSNALPRPSTVRELWRVYGLAVSLKSALGAAGARSWMHVGAPSPMDTLLAGDLRSVERRVARVVFDPRQARRFRPAAFTDTEIEAAGVATGPASAASRRRVRRAHPR